MKYNNLAQAMYMYCPCCGRGEEEAVGYVKEHDNDPVALYKEVIALGDCTGGDFISIILSHDYNVFVPWFKAVLIYFKNYGKTGVAWQAQDILEYYEKEFNEVGELHEI